MNQVLFRTSRAVVYLALGVAAAGCAVKSNKPAPGAAGAPAQVQCQAAKAGDTAVGNWYGVHTQRGVAGQLHVLIRLKADGTMSYEEQLKRGKKPSQNLSETGCWQHEQQTLVLRTLKSNGEKVESDDPIYSNRYTIGSQTQTAMVLDGPQGQLRARRMPDGYRLPF
ncbi:hypothetical protein [Eoetvoesiella caeni]